MVSTEDYGEFETAWCPGCGNHSIIKAEKEALAELGLEPHQCIFVSGIGQAAKAPHYFRTNLFNGLHGRSLPAATGAKLANPEAVVIAQSGDGCNYAEGGNHFLAALRRNIDITMLAHDNQIYGLTKGQASPTSAQGHKTKAQPAGNPSEAFNPVGIAVAMRAGFVARAFAGKPEHLTEMIVKAVRHKGFSLVDILQPCVTFNKVNTFAWYKERCYILEDHDPTQWEQAMTLSMEWGDRIPLGVIYRSDRQIFEKNLPHPTNKSLFKSKVDLERVNEIIARFG